MALGFQEGIEGTTVVALGLQEGIEGTTVVAFSLQEGVQGTTVVALCLQEASKAQRSWRRVFKRAASGAIGKA